MEVQNNEMVEIDVKELFSILLHKIWLIAIVGICFAICAGLISTYLIEPVYTSTTKIYIINRQEDRNLTLSDLQTGAQLTKDYMILVKSRPVMGQVINELKVDLTNEQLANMVSVKSPEGTRILEIAVEYVDPVMTKQLVDSIAKVSSERMVSVMEMEKVNVVEEGNLPISPTSPNIQKNITFGSILGIVLAAGFIIVKNLMNDTIRSTEDIEKYLGIMTLSSIPYEEGSYRKDIAKNSKTKHSKRKSDLVSSRRIS